MSPAIIDLAIRKALQSTCHYRVSAIGLDNRGNILGVSKNYPRFTRLGGGVHAEIALLRKYGHKIKTIIICRINKRGMIMPIKPCINCRKIMAKKNIKIMTIEKE